MSCAFTQKNYKLSKMLMSLGHEVIYYGSEGSTVPCSRFVQTHSLKDICKEWGDGDNRFSIGYDYKNGEYRHDFNSDKKEVTKKFYRKCIEEINRNKKADDFLLITQGRYQKPIDDGVKLFLTCEPGIGYRGSYCKYRAFESSYIQNFTYGSQWPFQSINGHYYDRVIPNYFEDEDFEFGEKADNYFLYIGRLIKRKGIITAHLAAKALNTKLVIVGQGGKVQGGTLRGSDFSIPSGTWEYHGYADVEKRKKLMSKAKATFVPTEYLEPFAGTHIESMLSGTPVITTNFGVFPETVINGVNGFRCDTLNDFVKAGNNINAIDRSVVRKIGEKYLTENVKHEYQKWFDDIYDVYESSLDSTKKGWNRIR